MLSRSFLKSLVVILLSTFLSAQGVGGKAGIGGKAGFGGGASGGGGASLISHVTGQSAGQNECAAAPTLSTPGSLTTGNDLIVTTVAYSGASDQGHSTPSFSSGTATLGAFVEDKTQLFTDSATYWINISIWRAPINGSGTAAIAFTESGACFLQTISEYSRTGGHMTVDGTPSGASGSVTPESTGNIITTTGGLVIMASSEVEGADFTYTLSDIAIYSVSTASSTFTGESQYKITGSSGTYNLSAGISANAPWGGIGVAYK